MTLLVRRYPYLHKIDNLCVDFKNKTVKYELNQKRVHILRTSGGSSHKFILDEKTCKKLSGIVEKRHSQEKTFNEKIEHLEAEVRYLKTSIRNQHEEMKSLLQQILRQRMTEIN
jgi:acetate kinase